MEVEDESCLTQLRFDAAVKVIKSLPPDGPFQPSNDMMLKFYSYYKQATVGACNIPRPGFWDAVGKAKWDAWNSLGDMSKEDAMAAYVDEMKLILEGMPMTDEVEQLLRVLGPFYELVDEKKKISQISDISTGFGTMMNSVQSKSVAKSIVRAMEMNGTLETRLSRLKPEAATETSTEEPEEEEEEDGEEETRKDTRSKASQPKKKSSARGHKVGLSNGKVANGVSHLTNGSDRVQDGGDCRPLLNGHHTDPGVDVSGPAHLASDSDSEVYCDSVDQFGEDENSGHNRSLDDLDEEENPLQTPLDQEAPEEGHGAPQVLQCGGEDGDPGAKESRRQVFDVNSSSRRSVKGCRSPGGGSGALAPAHSSGDGAGSHRGGAAAPGGSLDEQIVVALARLQEDMQSVLQRLHTLEALTATQARSVAMSPGYPPTQTKKSQKPSWWPFDISPTSLAFAVIWPFVVQWLIRLYLQRRRRRIN